MSFHSMITTLSATTLEALTFFMNPEKRVFWGYLLSSLIIAMAAALFSRSWKLFTRAFKLNNWWNRSSLIDAQWLILNHLIRVFALIPLLGSHIAIAMMVNRTLVSTLGEGNVVHWSATSTALCFTFVLFIFDDFSRFFVHYLYHKLPLLWRFHAIHHSAPTLTPLTLYRIHTVEMTLNSCRSMLIVGSISGLFMYMFSGVIGRTEVLGASLFNVVFNMAGANLRHSPIWLGFGVFESLFISPAQHQIHHSTAKRHYDKNFGSALAIWDRLFGSWVASQNEHVTCFGLKSNLSEASRATRIKTLFFGLKT